MGGVFMVTIFAPIFILGNISQDKSRDSKAKSLRGTNHTSSKPRVPMPIVY